MNKFAKYLALAALTLTGMGALSSCQDDFDTPSQEVPVAKLTPNTTIAEIKELFWDDATNYIDTIGTKENGDHYVIAARVISSDYDGNIFKCLYVQDATGALPMSINQYNLYLDHRQGQELVIDLTGMYIGKYNGMQQLGYPEWYTSGNCWEASFMAPEFFNAHCELNGLPDIAKVDTITVNDFSLLGSNPSDLRKWQGQLVRFNNAKFANAGKSGEMLCAEYHSSGYNQTLNVNGGSITVRTSGYAKFWNTTLPAESCDVVGILSYYGSTGWQLLLNDVNGLMNIGTPTGSEINPYTVAEAISFANAGSGTSGWVSGYIVGEVAPEVTSVSSNSDVLWNVPFVLGNTLVIGPTPTCTDVDQCLVIQLPEGSTLAEYGSLADHPDNLGRMIGINGTFATVLGTAGVTGFSGTSADFYISGVELPDAPVTPSTDGDGTQDSPYSVTQVLGLGNPGTTAWVKGYIVGWVDGQVLSTGANFNANATSQTNVLIAAKADETNVANCIPVQLPTGTVRTALNLQSHPENLGAEVAVYGSLEKYFGTVGIKSVTEYVLGETSGGTTGGGTTSGVTGAGTDSSPYTVADLFSLGNPGTEAWVEAYIVGWVDGQVLSTGANFNANATSQTNLLIAASASETNVDNCIPVQLPYGDVRTALNLQDHPEYYGKKVKLYGTLTKYFGVTGLKSVTAYSIDGTSGGSTSDSDNTGSGSTSTVSGAGSETSPYTVSDVLALGNPGSNAWVKGYIVGWVEGQVYSTGANFNADATVQSNLLLAASASETNVDNCIPVQLPTGDIRTALNLQDHPENYGKEISLYGTLTKYFGVAGLKAISEYKF
jgi:hypothetical protein